MARPKELLDEELVLKAKDDLKQLSNYKVCLRLQAIVSSKDYPISHEQIKKSSNDSKKNSEMMKAFLAQQDNALFFLTRVDLVSCSI
ncbi:hypothetical protein KKB18_03805 [bacterium]|nr:hypothetical protein [bacterium]